MRSLVWALAPSLACAATSAPPQLVAPPAAPAAPAAPTLPGRLEAAGEVVFTGMCDASGAVELDATRFMVADDEDNVLRVYDARRGGAAVAEIDVSRGVGLTPRGKAARMPELDLEAATRRGDHAYWLTSHGRNSKGKLRPERLRFFATTLPDHGDAGAGVGAATDAAGAVTVVASSDRLLGLILADPRFAALGLAEAAQRAPKAPGGLNLEGMTAGPRGLLFGFRNPVPEGLALLFHLDDPDAVLAGAAGPLGPPLRLDLGGHGVRALSWWRGHYLIVAGHHDTGGPARLYAWAGHGAPRALEVDLGGYNPEATFTPESAVAGAAIMLLSDDGAVLVDGQPCKELADHDRRRFRGVWLRPAG